MVLSLTVSLGNKLCCIGLDTVLSRIKEDQAECLTNASQERSAEADRCADSVTPRNGKFWGLRRTTSSSDTGSAGSSMLQFEWRIDPSRLAICRRANGKAWKLGSGGCGSVYKAVLDDVMEVAVKFLNSDGVDGVATNMRQFASEVDIMRACRNNNVVNFLGAWLDQSEV